MSLVRLRDLHAKLSSAFSAVVIPLGAVLAALLVGAAIIASAGLDPLTAYYALWSGAFGSIRSCSETLVRFCPLALCALAVLIAFRASFFTIGVDGQLYMGALASTLVGLTFPDGPPSLIIPVAALAGATAGALWALLAGFLKIRLGVNEVISTIMLNYIATLFIDYMVRGPIRAPNTELQYTSTIGTSAWLPLMAEHSRLHWGVALPLVAAILISILLWRTRVGFHIRLVGANPIAARRAGVNVAASVLTAVAISGALAGLAGAVEIQGVFHRLQDGIASDYGYTAIPIALVGKAAPGATLVAALFFAALSVGATMMQLKASVPVPVVLLIKGLVVLFVVGSEAFRPGAAARWKKLRQALAHGDDARPVMSMEKAG